MSVEVGVHLDGADVEAARAGLAGYPAALAAGDASLWGADAQAEAGTRLGWLDLPSTGRELLPELDALAARMRAEGLDNVVLAGMGGSSLAPEVICATADVPLTVLDTTDPGQVRRALADLGRTLLVVSSKSGMTIETDSHRRIFEQAFRDAGIDPAGRIVVVTDPGSPLEKVAAEHGYQVFLADPSVGGRYSALSAFGLVPSALAGADVRRLLDDAAEARTLLDLDAGNPGLDLGAALGAAALAGRDKMILRDALSEITGLPDWIEQLVAESTGKDGRGILPVVGADAAESHDQFVVNIDDRDATWVEGPLGAQFLVWEYATAAAGRLLGINPFDQPNVAESKQNTALLLDSPPEPEPPTLVDGPVEIYGPAEGHNLADVLTWALRAIPDKGYLAISAFLDREAAFDAATLDGDDFELTAEKWAAADIATLRALLDYRTDRPITFGWGPRYLHSTGQYHKGGPQLGVFLQVTGVVTDDIEVPGRPFGLGRLQLAQAIGDSRALAARGRPVVRLHLTDRVAGVAHVLSVAEEL
ncbi:glucose-6-phosphate isomerase [Streptosporangiaceae bacterium NEAU-GS5]|nr:glucose-6-phosphate isomerase [Streptosporangiaceae bacterium NEAU-GS5]